MLKTWMMAVTGDNYIRVKMPFNSLMAEFFEGSDTNDLRQRMLAYIKTQTENLKFPESVFTLYKIMHMYINFHRLVLTCGSSSNELPEWIKSKKVVIIQKTRMKSALYGLSLQHYIRERLKKMINAYRN